MNLEDIYTVSKMIFQAISMKDLLENYIYNKDFVEKDRNIYHKTFKIYSTTLKDLLVFFKEHSFCNYYHKDIEKMYQDIDEFLKGTSDYSPFEFKKWIVILTDKLNKFGTKLENPIRAEFNKFKIWVPHKGKLDSEKVWEGPEAFLDEKIWNKLKDIEKKDLENSLDCYSIEAFTPSGLMISRTVESIARSYYKYLTKREIMNNKGYIKNFNTILTELKDFKADFETLNINKSEHDNLISSLFKFKDELRNPLAHPERLLNENEVSELFFFALKFIEFYYNLEIEEGA